MEYEFYIDLFFLMDFYMNVLSLSLTAALIKKRAHPGALGVAAALGSLWNCFLILCPIFPAWAEMVLTAVGVGSVMVMAAFFSEMRTKRRIIAADLALLGSSSLLSGLLTFSRQHFYLADWESLVFTGALCTVFVRFLKIQMKPHEIGKERYIVWLYYRGKKKEFTALADSGNRLTVPETGKPVSLISYRDCIGFCNAVAGGFYIPYRAVGTESGVIFATYFEKMEISKDGICITIKKPAVAIAKECLSSNGEFSMLLPEEYIQTI